MTDSLSSRAAQPSHQLSTVQPLRMTYLQPEAIAKAAQVRQAVEDGPGGGAEVDQAGDLLHVRVDELLNQLAAALGRAHQRALAEELLEHPLDHAGQFAGG